MTRSKQPQRAPMRCNVVPGLMAQFVEIERLTPSPTNARRHDERNLAAIQHELEARGFHQSLVVQRKGDELVVRIGNGRLEAAKRAGFTHVPVTIVDEGDVDALAREIADNRTGELAAWDDEALAEGLALLAEHSPQLARGVGFDDLELDRLIGDALREHSDPPSTPAEPRNEEPRDEFEPSDIETAAELEDPEGTPAITQTGDVWVLGPHRLGCGDCRDRDFVATVLDNGGEPVPLMVSDPPYCSGGFQESQRAAGTFGNIAADNLSGEGYRQLIMDALAAALPRAVYVFTDWRMFRTLLGVVEGSGIAARSMIVWDKGNGALGNLWRAQHELVLFATRDGNKRRKGTSTPGNLIRCARSGNKHHYTEKPVELIAALLKGDWCSHRAACDVYDPFTGSGSTMLAAELEGRAFRGLEVEPRFVDVAVARWEKLTGRKADLTRRRGKVLREDRSEAAAGQGAPRRKQRSKKAKVKA